MRGRVDSFLGGVEGKGVLLEFEAGVVVEFG